MSIRQTGRKDPLVAIAEKNKISGHISLKTVALNFCRVQASLLKSGLGTILSSQKYNEVAKPATNTKHSSKNRKSISLPKSLLTDFYIAQVLTRGDARYSSASVHKRRVCPRHDG